MAPSTTSASQIELRDGPGGEHGNVSTFIPPVSQNQKGDDSEGGSGNSSTIIVGVLVPLVIIGIIALSVYIWYRKKYPVRMVIGKDFSTFSNPAYNKRASTLTLVRDDGNKVFESMSQRNSVIEEESEGLDERDGQDNRGFESDTIVYENTRIGPPPETVKPENLKNENENQAEAATVTVVTEPNIARERPRKRAVLIKTEDLDDLDSGFELVTEADIGVRRPSEISAGNDSTDTRTISLSFSDTFNEKHLKARSHSEDIGLLKSVEEMNADKNNINGKTRSNSDSVRSARNRGAEELTQNWPFSDIKSLSIAEKTIESDEDEFEKLEQAVMKIEHGDITSIPENIIQEVSLASNKNTGSEICVDDGQPVHDEERNHDSDTDDSFEVLDQTELKHEEPGKKDKSDNAELEQGMIKSDTFSENGTLLTDKNRDGLNSSGTRRFSEEIIKKPMHAKNNASKRLSLQLSSENIVLDTEPPTPTVIVPDSIIFEPETPNPILLDRTSNSPRRGRRAFTLNDIVFKMEKSTGSIESADVISKSSPEIFLEQERSHCKEAIPFAFESDNLKQSTVTLSDSNIDRSFDESLTVIKPGDQNIVQQKEIANHKDNASLFLDTDTPGNIDGIPAITSDESDTDTSADQGSPSESSSDSDVEFRSKPKDGGFSDKILTETRLANTSNKTEYRSQDDEFRTETTSTNAKDANVHESMPFSESESENSVANMPTKVSKQCDEDISSESFNESDIERELSEENENTDITDEKFSVKTLSVDNKKKIISASFKFNMDANDDEDSEDDRDDSTSTVDSSDFSIIPNERKSSGSAAVSFTDIGVDDQHGLSIMARSNDSNMSWEILNKSPEPENKDNVAMTFSFGVDMPNLSDPSDSDGELEEYLPGSRKAVNSSVEVLDANRDNSEC